MEITPHRRSLEGSEKPSKKFLIKFGSKNTNTCLVNTIKAIQNQTQGKASTTKGDVFTVMKEAIKEGNKKLKLELHKDMKELKNDIVREAHIYADEINEKLKKQIMEIQSTPTLALTGMQQITGVAKPSLMLQDQPDVE